MRVKLCFTAVASYRKSNPRVGAVQWHLFLIRVVVLERSENWLCVQVVEMSARSMFSWSSQSINLRVGAPLTTLTPKWERRRDLEAGSLVTPKCLLGRGVIAFHAKRHFVHNRHTGTAADASHTVPACQWQWQHGVSCEAVQAASASVCYRSPKLTLSRKQSSACAKESQIH